MSSLNAVSIDDICRRGSIKDVDVLRLRRLIYGGDGITADEAKQLFRINEACKLQDPSWADFFIEAITDYVINEAEPRGYITKANAEWLIANISHDGRVDTKSEIELLVNLLDKARWAPESLVRFALEQVKAAVVSGDGPLRAGLDVKRGEITEGEVELLRRILYAFGGDSNIAITRAEAEVLFEINDATANEPMQPVFTELFVKAITNCVMAASSYAVPSREEAMKRETWLESRGDLSVRNVLAGMAAGWSRASYSRLSAEEAALERLERQRIEIITNEEVTQGEVEWLAARLSQDGRLTPNEEALVAYLKRENPKLHPTLEPIIEKLSSAA